MRFVKMHGCGNDYIYINGFCEHVEDPPQLARQMSRAHFGVGADGLILVLPSDCADFRMRMFNKDGSEGVMCGNGARCVGRFVYEQGLTARDSFTLETGGGIRDIRLNLHGGDVRSVCVDMGPVHAFRQEDGRSYVSVGNAHYVFFTEENPFEWDAFDEKAAPVCHATDANIEYVQVCTPQALRMRVFERGSGETFACGSGTCASLYAAYMRGLCAPSASIEMRGGVVRVTYRPSDGHILLDGPAETVFTGEWLDAGAQR